MTKPIAEYVVSEYNQIINISSTIENYWWYTIPSPTAPFKTITTTENYFDTMVFKIEVDTDLKRKSILKDNIHNSYCLILVRCTEVLKIKIKWRKGWSKAFTKFYVLGIIKIIRSIILEVEYQNYQPILIHQEKTNFYIFCQGNMTNAEYLEKLNNQVDMILYLRPKFFINILYI